MRIAFVTPLVSRKAGGLFVSVRELAEALGREPGVDLKVFGAVDEHTREDAEFWKHVNLACLQTRGPKSLFFIPRLVKALREFSPDIVHVHGIWTLVSKSTRDYCRSNRVPYVISPRGCLEPWALRQSRLKKRLAWWAYERAHLNGAAVMHALAENEHKSFRNFGLKMPVAIVANGISVQDNVAPPAPAWLGDILARDKRVLLFLGRLHPKKGVVNMIKAAGILKRNSSSPMNDWHFVIGGWDEVNHLSELRQEIAKNQLETSVTIPGPLHGEEKDGVLGNVHGFILPSFSEGLPMAVLEAWRWRLPTLITPACNLDVAFGRGAALKIETEPVQLAEGLKRLFEMTRQQREEMGAAGRALVNEKFGWRDIASDMRRVYDWMLDRSTTPPRCLKFN